MMNELTIPNNIQQAQQQMTNQSNGKSCSPMLTNLLLICQLLTFLSFLNYTLYFLIDLCIVFPASNNTKRKQNL